MRHSRRAAYADAWTADPASRWSDLTTDPNDPPALAHRARTLHAARMPPIADRIGFLSARCADKNVLDIGCVAHDAVRMDDDAWLHRHIAHAAASCVGVDILEDGVGVMRAAGFDAIAHDLSTGLGPLAERAPFDVIVAGELIEHLTDLDLLFRVAQDGLADDGELILTTPNPYAPARVRAGQRGVVWENADHVAYLFPSGIAELAERNGLALRGATTITDPEPARPSLIRRVKRLVRGARWRAVGYDTGRDAGRQVPVEPGLLDRLRRRAPASYLGETSVYVLGRRAEFRP